LGNDPLIAYARAMVDLYDGSLQEAATRLPSEAWEVCESQFHFVPKALLQAQIHDLLNQPQPARSFYESARNFADAKARQLPDEAFFRGALGIAYAGLGRKQDAIREGKAAVDLLPVSKDAFRGLYVVEELARIHVMVGEYEAALDRLEYLMSIPGDLGAGALRLDPAWKPLRDHPRFQALIRRYGK
jgi:tetratricopeptide (TPR) repeat protein